jgi:hypothetical protein
LIFSDYEPKEAFVLDLFKICLGNGKNFNSIARTISLIILQISCLPNIFYDRILANLGIDELKKQAFYKIYSKIKTEEEESFIGNLKDWMKIDTSGDSEIDY